MSHGKMNPEVFKIKTLLSKNISFFLTESECKEEMRDNFKSF